jgi:hypothetical protein
MTGAARKLPELFITEERGAGQALAAIGTVSYRRCVNASARTGYLSREDRDRIAVDLAQQAADVR